MNFLKKLNNRIVESIPFMIDRLQHIIAKTTYLFMNSTGVHVSIYHHLVITLENRN